jgi:hypothetical protein
MPNFGSAGYYPQNPAWTAIDTLGNSPFSASTGAWNTGDYAGAIAAINRDDDGVGFPSTSCHTGALMVRVFGCTMSGPNNYYINYFHYGDVPGEAALLGTTVVDKPSTVCTNTTATMWHTPYTLGAYGGALPPEYFSWW